MTDLQAAREAAERLPFSESIWLAAHKVAADTMPQLQSGICQQPGLAAKLAMFAEQMIREHVAADPTVLMKPPKWACTCNHEGYMAYELDTVLGKFLCDHERGGAWVGGMMGTQRKLFASLSAAQAACEADLRKRVRALFKGE